MEIIQYLFSGYSGIKLEINNRKMVGKSPNTRKLRNTQLNNPWVKEENSREILKYFELIENGNTTYQQDKAKASLKDIIC